MKKLLLALPLLTLPLTAMAQDKQATMPQSIIDAAKKRFEPAFCSNDVSKMTKIVYDCYMNIAYDPSDLQYQECILGDQFLSIILNIKKKHAQEEGKADPYPNLPSFFDRQKANGRLKRFFNILDTKGYSTQDKKDYMLKPYKNFSNYIYSSCNK